MSEVSNRFRNWIDSFSERALMRAKPQETILSAAPPARRNCTVWPEFGLSASELSSRFLS